MFIPMAIAHQCSVLYTSTLTRSLTFGRNIGRSYVKCDILWKCYIESISAERLCIISKHSITNTMSVRQVLATMNQFTHAHTQMRDTDSHTTTFSVRIPETVIKTLGTQSTPHTKHTQHRRMRRYGKHWRMMCMWRHKHRRSERARAAESSERFLK